jgi:type II secretory pathway component PulF
MALNGISTATSSTSILTKLYRQGLKLAEAKVTRSSTGTNGYRVLHRITATHIAYLSTSTSTVIGSASPVLGHPWTL